MELGHLYWSTGLNTSGLKKDSSKASGILGKLSGGMGKLMNPAALGISAVAGAALKLGKDAYQFSKQFNSAMLEVKTISTAAQDNFAGMSQSIMDISLQGVNDDAVGLSNAMYQIVSAGFDGAEGLALLESSAKAATGGVTDTITAADGLTTVLNAWGMSATEVDKVSDQMFTTVKLGKTTMGELGKNIAKVAPLAAATGVEFEQIAAATATMTSQGTKTTEVMTQMKAGIVALNENLGDGWAETMTLQEGFAQLSDMAGGSDTKLQELTGSSEAMLAVLSLTGDNADKASEHLESMGSSAGAANAAFQTMADDADIIWKTVGNRFKAAMSDIGDGLLNASKGIGKFLAGIEDADPGESFVDTATKVALLTDQLKDQNITLEEQKSIMNQLSAIDPSLAAGVVEDEVVNYDKLNKNMAEFNEQQFKQAELARLNLELQEQQLIIQEDKRKQQHNQLEFEKVLAKERINVASTAFLKGDENKESRVALNAILDDTTKEASVRLRLFTTAANKIATDAGLSANEFGDRKIGTASGQLNIRKISVGDKRALKKAQEQVDLIKSQIQDVKATITIDPVVSEDKPVIVPIKPRIPPKTIKELQDELAALEKKRGGIAIGDLNSQLKLEQKILKKNTDIEAVQKKIHEGLYGSFTIQEEAVKVSKETIEQAETLSKELYDQLDAEMEALEIGEAMTEEEEKYLIQQEKEYKNQIKLNKKKEEALQILDVSLLVINELTAAYESLGNEMSEQTQETITALSTWGQLAMDVISQNWLGVVSGSIKMITDLIDLTTESMDELKAEFNDVLGVSPDILSENIVDGILGGFELAESGLGDFGEGFEKIMADAARNALISSFTDQRLKALMKNFTAAFEDGTLTDEERADLQQDYKDAIEATQKEAEAWRSVIGVADQVDTYIDSSGFSDAVSGITEQTADLLEGQFNALRINTLSIIDIMDEHTGYLSEIAQNTLNTAELLVSTNNLLSTSNDSGSNRYTR